MNCRKKLLLGIISLFATGISYAQSIPPARQFFHDKIDASQKLIMSMDGNKSDKNFHPTTIAEINKNAHKAATKDIDNIQKVIERNGDLNGNEKIGYLKSLNDALENFARLYKSGDVKGSLLITLVSSFEDAMLADFEGESIEPVLRSKGYDVIKLVSETTAFEKNAGQEEIKHLLVEKIIDKDPSKGLALLEGDFDKYPRKDSLLSAVALKDQEVIYNWARSYGKLGRYILNDATDPLVKTIGNIARTKQGRQYFPFLDDLYKGKITVDEIDAVLNNPQKYYSLLVKTNINYAERIANKETVYGKQAIDNKVKEVGEATYINKINALHSSPAGPRFASIRNLTPQELYYLVVMNEEVTYTSSYVTRGGGLYNQVFANKITGDELIQSVYADHYRKWIKMASIYNTLDDFISRMETENARTLMKAFVRNLDQTKGKDSLQDAVDVAGSFSSIKDPKVKDLVLTEVKMNRENARREKNLKKFRIYDVLNTLFMSMDDPTIDLTATLGIDPVYFMNIDRLKDTSGRVVIQQFFYGDDDGRLFYPDFMNRFSGSGWRVKQNQYWSEVSTTSGTPITIYTNKPLYKVEGDGMDKDAQDKLQTYFDENGIEPKIVIHRGHSYHLPETIEQLASSSKVVLLGSCGGFQSLNEVLERAPGTQIISSKQTGTGALNIALITSIVDRIRAGKDLDWVNMWKALSEQNKNDAYFADYVPPYQNLGAVFLMAFQKMHEADEQGVKAGSDITASK